MDVLLLLKPEEYQLHEWLFVTDTIDAIYPPVTSTSLAAADLLDISQADQVELHSTMPSGLRKPRLCTELSRKSDSYGSLLGSFFGQLSIRVFEDTYSLEPVDVKLCREDTLADIFHELD